jgi:hypothetical protein
VGLVVGSPRRGYTLYSYGAHNIWIKRDNLKAWQFDTLGEALRWARKDGYDGAKIFLIKPEGIGELENAVHKQGAEVYNGLFHNCLHVAVTGLRAGGVGAPHPKFGSKPSHYFTNLAGAEYIKLTEEEIGSLDGIGSMDH